MLRPLGLYFASMIAAMLLSLPIGAPTLLAAKAAPPWAVALTATLAAAITATIDHAFMRRTSRIDLLARVLAHPLFQRIEGWIRVAPGVTTFAFASVPLPFLIVRVMVPLSGYPWGRYVAAVAAGRFARVFVIATFGTVVEIPNEVLLGLVALGIVSAVAGAIARRLGWIGARPALPPAAAAVEVASEACEEKGGDATKGGDA